MLYIYMSLSFARSLCPWKVFDRGVVQCVCQKPLVGVYARFSINVSNDRVRRSRDADAGVTTLASSGSALPLSAFRSAYTISNGDIDHLPHEQR